MEEDTKRRFKEEFDETVHDVMVNFGKSEETTGPKGSPRPSPEATAGKVRSRPLSYRYHLQRRLSSVLSQYEHTHNRKLRTEAFHREARRSVPFQIKICFSSNFTSR